MPEKDAKGSSLDVTALMKKGLKSIAISGTKWAIGKGLNAAFGWESAKDKKQNWVKDTLNNITAELTVIQQDIANLSTQLSSLSMQIETDSFIEANGHLSQDFISLASTSMKAFERYQHLVEGLNSGNENLDREGLIEQIVSKYDKIDDDLAVMENMLRTNPKLDAIAKNMLETWTDAMIVRYKNGEGEPLDWYMSLETKTKQLLQVLFQAYIIQVNIKNHQTEDLDENPDTRGIDYLESEVAPILHQIAENYRTCVERFVLSTYRPDINPSKDNQPKIQFVDGQKMVEILKRTDLMCWLIDRMQTEDPNPGLFYTSFTRPSLLSKDSSGNLQGASLQPNAEFKASTGELVAINSSYNGGAAKFINHWYRCLDFADGSQPGDAFRIRSFQDSAIRTLRYHWPFEGESVTLGAAVGNGPVFGKMKVQFYDKFSFAPVDESAVEFDEEQSPMNALLLGSFAEGDSLRENILMSYLATYSDQGWVLDPTKLKLHEVPGNQMSECTTHYRFDEKLPYYGEVKAKLYSTSHSSSHKRSAKIVISVDYEANHEKRDIGVIMDSDYSGKVEKMPGDGYAAKGHIDYKFRISYPEKQFKYGGKPPKEKTDDIEKVKSSASHVKYKSEDGDTVTLYSQSRISFEWELVLHIESGKEYYPLSHSSTGTSVVYWDRPINMKWNIENFRLAWPFPNFSPS